MSRYLKLSCKIGQNITWYLANMAYVELAKIRWMEEIDRMEERYDPMEHGYDSMECKSRWACIFVQNAPPYERACDRAANDEQNWL